MSLFSGLFESANEVPNVVNDDVDNKVNNDNDNNNNVDNNNDDEKKVEHPLYKIVQEFMVLEMKEKDFYNLNNAVSYWESLTYLAAAIWYQWDENKKIWKIKDTYGTSIATNRIINYIDTKYNNKNKNDNNNNNKDNDDQNNVGRQSSSSLLSYFTSFSGDENDDNNNNNDDDAQNSVLLDEFFKWTESFTKKSGVKPTSRLDADDKNAKDLIVSIIWNVGFQCYFLHSYQMANTTWKSLGSWYASVWFTRHDTGGVFVLHENFGTSESVRRICRYVNDSQARWIEIEKKKKEKLQINNKNDEDIQTTIDDTKQTNDDDEENCINDEDEDEDDSKLCIVCLDGDRDHILIPCGHICVCKNCKGLYEKNDATCPMCRGKVEKVIKTFK